MQALRERGWDPVIPEVYGNTGTGYRSIAEQLELKRLHPERTSVKFSFHSATYADGRARAMAVHIMDRKRGNSPKHGDPFIMDMEMISQRFGLQTGNSWKKPWDPLHVQLFNNKDKAKVERGEIPHLLPYRLVLLPPVFGQQGHSTYLPPTSPENFKAGEVFELHQGSNIRNGYKSLSRESNIPAILNTNSIPKDSFAPLPALLKPAFGSSGKYYSPDYKPEYAMGNLEILKNPMAKMRIANFQLTKPR